MELIAHQPIATLVASLFQLTRQPDAKGQSQVTRRSHGQFDLESCPVQYPWLNPFLMLNMNLQNVNQDHFSLASGRPQDHVTSLRVSVGIADTLQYYMVQRAHEAPQMQSNVISDYY